MRFIFLLLITVNCFSQNKDLIISLDGNELKCEIKDIGKHKLTYEVDGLLKTIPNDSVFIIKRSNEELLKYTVAKTKDLEITIAEKTYLKSFKMGMEKLSLAVKEFYEKDGRYYYTGIEKALKEKNKDSVSGDRSAFIYIMKLYQATRFFKEAINNNQNSDSAYYYLSVAKRMNPFMKKKLNYLDELKKAIELNPKKIKYYGDIFYHWDGYGESHYYDKLKIFDSAIRLMPDNCELHYYKSEILLLLDDYQQAFEEITNSIQLCGVSFDKILARLEINFNLLKIYKNDEGKINELQRELGSDYVNALLLAEGRTVPNKYKKYEKFAN